jgi:hypothetical protein
MVVDRAAYRAAYRRGGQPLIGWPPTSLGHPVLPMTGQLFRPSAANIRRNLFKEDPMTLPTNPATIAGLVVREVRTGSRDGAPTKIAVARRSYPTDQAACGVSQR